MKRVLLTGGTGFVGANLCRRLLAEGHEVFCLLRPDYKRWRIADIEADLQIRIADVRDANSLEVIVGAIRPEWIFHLAAFGAYSWQTDTQQIVRTNLLGTANLIQACLKPGFEIFINAGSSSEYGFKDHAPEETEPLEPNSQYAVAKAGATLYCQFVARSYEASVVTLRLYSVYGPFEEPNRLIPNIITRGLRGELPALVDPDTGRDFVHVHDIENACLEMAEHPPGTQGAVFNVGTGVQTRVADVVRLAQEVFRLRVEPHWHSMPSRAWDTTVWKADNRALVGTGWRPTMAFEEGFKKTVDWFEQHPELMPLYAGD